MNFSIHVDDELAETLARIAAETGRTRNALVGQALREFLERRQRLEWPVSVRAHLRSNADTSDLEPFESHRAELGDPDEPAL